MAKRKAATRGQKRAGSTARGRRTTSAARKTKAAARRRPARKPAARKRPAARAAKTRSSAARRGAAPARKATARKATARKATARKATARKATARKATARKATTRKAGARSAATAARRKPSRPPVAAVLARKTRPRGLPPEPKGPPSSLDFDQSASAFRTGREELFERFREHPEKGSAITGGDIDADWQSAYSVGDEAPGGDSPTPDQDIVDDIGRAVGVEYADAEELKGDEKITRRDRHRWELDPASSEDFEDR